MASAPKQRLDEWVVARGWARTRSQAKALILSGRVLSGTERLDKPGKLIAEGAELRLEAPPRFVSRGGEKLAAALEGFAVDLRGARVLDLGASTGGFTDCALQAGASAVTCVDVGRAQLHSRLRTDARVVNLEKVNARSLDSAALPLALYDAVLMDLSFISLTMVLAPAWRRLRPGGTLIALVKPQFEAGKAEADRGRGVIRDAAVRVAALNRVRDFALARLPGAQLLGVVDSPIAGADGNREYLLGLRRAS